MGASNKIASGGGSVDGYTPEALRVGRALKHDFEKSGIHLPEGQRSRLTGLIDLERRIGMQIGTPCLLISQALAFLGAASTTSGRWQIGTPCLLFSQALASTLGAICRDLSFGTMSFSRGERPRPARPAASSACGAGQNLTMSSKLGYLDMDAPGLRKSDQQSVKPTLGQGGSTRRVVLHPGALHSLLQNEPAAEHRERVCSCSVRLHRELTGLSTAA